VLLGSFENLSEGLQNALWELGGVPLQHRTDRMSTAVNNMRDEREFTTRYEALLRHHRMEGQKIQAGKANENGHPSGHTVPSSSLTHVRRSAGLLPPVHHS
jgi:hypothetical protein